MLDSYALLFRVGKWWSMAHWDPELAATIPGLTPLIINVHSGLHAQPYYMAPVETHVDDVLLAPTIPVSSAGEGW